MGRSQPLGSLRDASRNRRTDVRLLQRAAEYFVLRSGQRLHVSGYQLLERQISIADGGRLRRDAGGRGRCDRTRGRIRFVPTSRRLPKAPFRDLIEAAAARYNVDAELIASVIAAESNFDPKAISRRNARGLMQLLPQTAARLGVHNIFDPAENIDAGTHYLRDLLALYQERSRAHAGCVQCRTASRAAIRPRAAVCRNTVLRSKGAGPLTRSAKPRRYAGQTPQQQHPWARQRHRRRTSGS